MLFVAIAAAVFLTLNFVVLLFARPTGTMRDIALQEVFLLAAVVVASAVMLRRVEHRSWAFIGLGTSQARPPRFVIGFLAGLVGIVLPSLVLLAVGWLVTEPSRAPHGWAWAVLVGTLFFLPQSLAEEMLVRGYPFAVVRERFGTTAAIIGTSLIFSLLHGANPGVTWESLLLVFVAGIFLAAVLVLTDSLWAAWMTHFAWNWAMAVLLHTAVSGIPSDVFAPDYRMVDSGPDWATGGRWGPEGGLGALFGMAIALAGVMVWQRAREARDVPPAIADSTDDTLTA